MFANLFWVSMIRSTLPSGIVTPRAASRSRTAESKSRRGRTAAVAAMESAVEIRIGRTQPGRRAIEANVGAGEPKTPASRDRGVAAGSEYSMFSGDELTGRRAAETAREPGERGSPGAAVRSPAGPRCG